MNENEPETSRSRMSRSEMNHSEMNHNEPDRTDMDHRKMDHSDMDHNGTEHRKMDHSSMEHNGMEHSGTGHSGMEHSGTGHSGTGHNGMDHSGMDHSGTDHRGMEHSGTDHGGMEHSGTDHSGTEHGGMDHSMHNMGNLKTKFIVSLILTIPIILLSPMMGIDMPWQIEFPGSEWVVLILATILYFYGGMPFLKGAAAELKNKSPAMMTLISLGISVAYFYSLYAFAVNNIFHTGAHVMDFFWELATLIVIMLLGHWIEMRAVSNAGDALQKMAELLPGTADVVQSGGEIQTVDLKNVQIGDHVLVKAGGKIPADGMVIDGKTTVNESMITGESKEVAKEKGSQVIGGSVNGSGTITVEVTGTGESGYLAQVMQLVGSAQKEKSKSETLSDKVARWLFYAAVSVSLIAFAVWYFLADVNTALERMVTVLVIACPHALGLAIPLVVARSTSIGAKNGLLVRNRNALETAPKTTVVMTDKTGTLTEGNFKVTGVRSLDASMTEEEILKYAGALEKNSSHPLSAGILKEIDARKIQTPEISDVNNIPGAGIEGTAEGKNIKIVSESYLTKNQISYDAAALNDLKGKGSTISFLLIGGQPVGFIAQGDQIKDGAKKMIDDLKARKIRPVMLTGDNEEAAQAVASKLGIEDVHAGLLPEDKEKIIQEYQAKGEVVMMVGDGVNDAPSLARADIGAAIGAGTDVAIDSADVVLVKSDPSDIIHFLSLSKNTSKKMKQNLWWGAGYNIIAIPLAAGILAPVGIILSPAAGAILMSLSTVIVAFNALTLKMDD
ncbi:Copper-exporting P-type ATPase B [Methanimicrococcus sp. At1]|uniref:Copper-exporting P-type ATPase B n=1 Tax=Methanimicrococcus hacksteinii TaxID=3028293 RepID=A0ABU3VMB2_9EURY|nr:copper-translocating P-type ATPase [Methanimicrococcus sp. At1]MDV0444543.1 Copper-exporting P-type ATPase B [Methanimicrococcus sp. At1]